MIIRYLLIVFILIGFTIDSQFAAGGSKFVFDLVSIGTFIFSALFTVSWVLFWDLTGPDRNIAKKVNPVLIFIMILIYYYEYNTGGRIDPSVFIDNWKGVANPQGFKITFHLLYDNFVTANLVNAGLIAWLVNYTYKLEAKENFLLKHRRINRAWMVLPFLMLGIIISYFHSTYEYYGVIARGFVDRIYSRSHQFEKYFNEVNQDPIETTVVTGYSFNDRPNIILVFVEAFSEHFVNRKSKANLEFTPVFNRFISRGHYFTKYYSISVQTSRAHFAALCGKIPIYQGLESIDFENVDFDCLPRYMENLGYNSILAKAYGNLDFDNQRNFF